MTKSKKPTVLALGIITIILMLSSQSGCNAVDEGYLTRIDTLNQKLILTEKYLSIDFATIQSREQRITQDLQHLKKYYDQTYTEMLGNNLTKYKAIKKAYSNFLNQYPSLYDEMKSLEKQVTDLRTSVNNRDLSKEVFKQYYQTELQDINSNLEFAENLNRSIHALEPEYQRISVTVAQTLTALASRNPEYKEVFDRDSTVQLD